MAIKSSSPTESSPQDVRSNVRQAVASSSVALQPAAASWGSVILELAILRRLLVSLGLNACGVLRERRWDFRTGDLIRRLTYRPPTIPFGMLQHPPEIGAEEAHEEALHYVAELRALAKDASLAADRLERASPALPHFVNIIAALLLAVGVSGAGSLIPAVPRFLTGPVAALAVMYALRELKRLQEVREREVALERVLKELTGAVAGAERHA